MNAIEKVQVIKIDSLTVFDGPIDVISKRKFVLVIERKLFFHSGEKSSWDDLLILLGDPNTKSKHFLRKINTAIFALLQLGVSTKVAPAKINIFLFLGVEMLR